MIEPITDEVLGLMKLSAETSIRARSSLGAYGVKDAEKTLAVVDELIAVRKLPQVVPYLNLGASLREALEQVLKIYAEAVDRLDAAKTEAERHRDEAKRGFEAAKRALAATNQMHSHDALTVLMRSLKVGAGINCDGTPADIVATVNATVARLRQQISENVRTEKNLRDEIEQFDLSARESQKDRDFTLRKLDDSRKAFLDLQQDRDALWRELQAVRTNRDGVWVWQGDGHDKIESLACPVVMTADTLRDLLKGPSLVTAVAEALAVADRLDDAAEALRAVAARAKVP